MNSMTIPLRRITSFVVALALVATPLLGQSDVDVVVDAAKPIGTFKNVSGVTCGPIGPYQGGIDLSNEFKWLRVPSVRIHDCDEVGDIDRVFPNFAADPTIASNYDFTKADALVNSIVNTGAKVLYRIGYSWGRVTTPPADFDKFAVICEHIAKHYTQGWANGYYYSSSFEWEIWNEANLRNAWTGTAEQFYILYTECAHAIRRGDPTARVGTCALAVNWPIDYQEKLIAYCADNKVPLDFYSWHYYGFGFEQAQPHDYVRNARWVRTLLDKYGFHDADNYLTEWNILHPSPDPRLGNMVGATYTLSALLFMQDSSIDLAHHYRGDQCDNDCGGLFRVTRTANEPIPRAWAFHLAARLLDTPQRLETTGSDGSGFAAAAGRSADGSTTHVLMSDFWSRGHERRLIVENLPARPHFMQVFDVNADGLVLTSTQRLAAGEAPELPLPTKSPWIRFVKLTAEHAGGATLASDNGEVGQVKPTGMLRLFAPTHIGKPFFTFASSSGTAPGTPLPGIVVPLNIDALTIQVILNLGNPGYDKLSGTVRDDGQADIPFAFAPLNPALVGMQIHFATLVQGTTGFDAVTNPVGLTVR